MGSTRIREINGRPEKFVFWVAAMWTLFQLWYASPVPYYIQLGLFNSTEARSISLAFAIFLGLSCYPIVQAQRAKPISLWEIIWALLGAGAVVYIALFYLDLSNRIGAYSSLDLAAGTIGLILLVDAARRAISLLVAIVVVGFIGYAVFGSGIGENFWKISFEGIVAHYWLTSESVFGIYLGTVVSVGFLGVVLGSGLDRLNFGGRFFGWVFCPYSSTSINDGVAPIPRWLKGRIWTWVFALQFLGSIQSVGQTGFLPSLIRLAMILALFLLLIGGKNLVSFARVRMGTNPAASIWEIFDLVIIIAIFLAVSVSHFFPYTVMAIIIALPIMVFRRIWEKQDVNISEAYPVTIKTEIETSAFGIVLVGLLSISLTTIMIGIGHLARVGIFTSAHTPSSTAVVAGSIVLIAIVSLTVSSLKNTERDFLPAALFLVIVAVLANGLYVSRLSPGLSGFEAVISGLALMVITPLASWSIHRNHTFQFVVQTTVMEVVEWMYLGGRNAVPVVLLAATVGIVVGTITFTGTGGWMMELGR